MMKRNYLWMLLASMVFVGCSQNDDLPEGNENQDKEVSYIAINVNATPSAGGRAATDGGTVAGTDAENKVKDAYFFFFNNDANGSAFPVSGYVPTNNNVTDDNDATTGGVNWVKYTFGDNTKADANGQLAAVLTLQKITNSYPAYVVAVLGWTPSTEQNKSYSLAELKDEILNSYKNNDVFIMSNSVYSDGTNNVYATALNPSNFATTETSAEASPVNIYVERVAARVTVEVDEENTDNIFAVKTADATPADFTITLNGESTPKQVYAKILGWDINTTADKSYLLKDIESNTNFFNGWNDATNYRSYWANNPTGITYDKSFKFSEFNNLSVSDYCLENAIDAAPASGAEDNRTNVIVKAQLGTLEGETFTGLSIAQWMGTYYAFDDLKGAVATALSNQLYYSTDGTTWSAINTKSGDEVPGLAYIGLVRGDGDDTTESADYYKASFTYVALTQGTIYWSFDGKTALTDIANGATVADQVTAKLNSLAPAKVWTDGTAYYYLPIEHLGSQYGVIRNHAYKIVINGVTGLGTPVYLESDTDDPEIPNPDKPEETETYIAARINVLSWKLITNEVTLQ